MSESFSKAKQQIFERLTSGSAGCGLITISGSFGCGKSLLVNEILKELQQYPEFDLILKFADYEKVQFLPEMCFELMKNPVFVLNNKSLHNEESQYNLTRYFELINSIKENANEYFDDVVYKSTTITNFQSDKEIQDRNKTLELFKDYLEKNSDKRLLMNTSRVIAEGMLVDLINSFFSFDYEDTIQDIIRVQGKKKILIIIEDISLLRNNVIELLRENLMPLCCNLSFGSFISYDVSFFPKDMMPSDFIDFSFIITSRDKKAIDMFEKFSGDDSVNIKLELFDDEEIVDFINNSGIDSTLVYEQFRKVSLGVPSILDLCLESHKLGQGLNELRIIYQSTAERILKNTNEKQKDWLRCASFLEKFDADGLRCFPLIREDYKDAFSFIIASGEFVERADEEGFYFIKPLIANILIEATKDTSKAMASSLTQIAGNYRNSLPFLKKFDPEDRNYLRQLAYFDRFDIEFTFEKAFDNQANLAMIAFKKHKDIFIKNEHTYSLNKDHKEGFDVLNKLLDFEKYEKKIKFANQIWKIYENKLLDTIKNSHELISKLKQEEQSLTREKKLKKQRYDELQYNNVLLENEHISKHNKMLAFSNHHNIFNLIVFSAFFVFLLLLGFLSPAFFDSIFTADKSYGKTFQMIFFMGAIVAATFCGISIYKTVKVKLRENERQVLKQELEFTDSKIEKQQKEMARIKQSLEFATSRIEEIKKERVDRKSKIDQANSFLKEPFIDPKD